MEKIQEDGGLRRTHECPPLAFMSSFLEPWPEKNRRKSNFKIAFTIQMTVSFPFNLFGKSGLFIDMGVYHSARNGSQWVQKWTFLLQHWIITLYA